MSVQKAFIVPHPPLIIPEVGNGQEKEIQNTIDAYEKTGQTVAQIKPETIVVITPHSIMYKDYIHISPGNGASGDFGRFGAPQVSIRKEYDRLLVERIAETAQRAGIPAGTLGEKDPSLDHGVLVPLYFIDRYDQDYQLVRISVAGFSPVDHYRFGRCIADAAESLGRKTVLITSGDLSHKLSVTGPYGYAKEGPEFDEQITDVMKTGDFLKLLQFNEVFLRCGRRMRYAPLGGIGRSVGRKVG